MSNLSTRLAQVERQYDVRPDPADLTLVTLVLLAVRQDAAAALGQDPTPADVALWAAFQADPRWAPLLAGQPDARLVLAPSARRAE